MDAVEVLELLPTGPCGLVVLAMVVLPRLRRPGRGMAKRLIRGGLVLTGAMAQRAAVPCSHAVRIR